MTKRGGVFLVIGLAGLILCFGGCRSAPGEQADRLVIGEVMLNSSFTENLRALSVAGGRLSGSESGHAGEAYVAEQARAYGLDNVRLEPFSMPGWEGLSCTVTVLDDPPLVLDGAIALANTLSTPTGGITAAVVDVGKGTEEEFEALRGEIAGRFVLAREGGGRRAGKMRRALDAGAVGLVMLSRKEREPIIGGCHEQPRPEPAVVIRYADGENLAERLAAGEEVRLNLNLETRVWNATPNNVIAEIPGTGPLKDEIVVVSAHLDGWHLGEAALDNAVGSVVILETARALRQIGWQPRRTVRFVWYMGEEQGLFGSRAYVTRHADELDRHVAVVNVDMAGRPDKFGHFNHPELEPFLVEITRKLRGYEMSEEIWESKGSWSDHAPFMWEGIPAMAIGADIGPTVIAYHTADDTYDKVDRVRTIPTSAVLGVLVRNLADATDYPGRRNDGIDVPAYYQRQEADVNE